MLKYVYRERYFDQDPNNRPAKAYFCIQRQSCAEPKYCVNTTLFNQCLSAA